MGGLDILKETAADGSLKEEWDIQDITSTATVINTSESLHDRLTKLVNRSNIMLFMKGKKCKNTCRLARYVRNKGERNNRLLSSLLLMSIYFLGYFCNGKMGKKKSDE